MPNWYDEGADVVRHAYEWHPLFMARKMRVEIAFFMNKPHMAEEMLTLLKRDGYPEELCRQITSDVRSNFRNRPKREVLPLLASTSVAVDSAAGANPNAKANELPESRYAADPKPAPAPRPVEGLSMTAASAPAALAASVTVPVIPDAQPVPEAERSDLKDRERGDAVFQGGQSTDPWIAPAHPYLSADLSHSKANDLFEILRYGGRAGLFLNHNLALSAEYYESRIKQRIRPTWNAVYFDWDDLDSYNFKAIKREGRARLTYRTPSGVTLSGSLGLATLDPYDRDDDQYDGYFEDHIGSGEFADSDNDTSIIGDLSAAWSPRDDLNLYVFYTRDLVTSAAKQLDSDSVGAIARWKPDDAWHVTVRGQYWRYEDDNALFYLQGDSFWETLPDMGVWLGLDASTITASDPSDYYWTPYWDKRVMGVVRYLQVWQGYTFRLDFLGGMQSQDGRPVRRSEEYGLGSGSDWELAWGVSSTYNKRLSNNLDIFFDGSVMALRDYVDHRFLIGFTLSF
jgi:hypothetical protein